MLTHINIFLSLAISFSIVYFVIPKIVKISKIKRLFDVPNHRSAAKEIVPTLGGIAILSGFAISLMIASNNYNINDQKYMFVSVIVMFLIGVKDDIIGLAAKKKLFVQIVVACYLVILGNFRFTNFHGILGIQEVGYISGFIFSVLAIVGIINAFNLIDGIDGLAGGVGLLISLIYGFWFLNAGDFIYALTCFSLAGSLIAFLLYNVFGNTNKIFMGDTGSLILGTIIAVLTIHFNIYYPDPNIAAHGLPAISIAIIIVPLIDTLRVLIIRISQKRSPFSPDKNHIHHNILLLTGENHLITSLIIIATNGLIVLFAFLCIDQIGNNLMFFLLLIMGFVLAGIPATILKLRKKDEKVNKSSFALFVFLKKHKS
jgi:UDP-GlcNAc:undecaprenyl-phosphate/decaprenyl-phosphate GlcNAc-1-phosphate transferase